MFVAKRMTSQDGQIVVGRILTIALWVMYVAQRIQLVAQQVTILADSTVSSDAADVLCSEDNSCSLRGEIGD
jgi:hypothetical protein